jgi:hypothetical protein
MPPALKRQFSQTKPALQSAFSSIDHLKPTVTSVIDGPHVKDSAHFDGRAIDVGAFNGVPVGWNKTTWDAIVQAILSGKWTRIGTIAPIVNTLGEFAKEHGVDLFFDAGTGPHVHLQVGP